jgi:hypothetical protein
MRRNPLFLGLALLTLLASAVWADTLYLTNGSVLQGNFLRLDNGQIFFQLTTGGDRDRGRVLRFTLKEVLRIVTDRDPDGTLSRVTPNTPTTKPTSTFDTATVDVRLTNDWINSNVQVVQGQRIRIDATGTVTLDGRNDSSPSGTSRRDPNAPLPEENDGALVASIGNDLSSPILLIGRSKEWVADRNGTLYFTVNHWDTANARGSYQVRVQTERMAGSPTTRPPVVSSPFACALPARFTETEGDYTAIWTRRGNTNEYDAVWSRNGRRQVTAVVTITTQGNRISILRGQGSDGVSCQYDGTVGTDGTTITGTASCGGTRFNFQARAECN